ncbi:alpha/beta fold hydrolase [Rhodococcus wratislaviensis]|uniref:Putative hydrolase n=1 Tax=Rhodococcus wratislaviensis NBRC 100605 TaxID=1219028 RepID=X0Q7X4_RHOWR|nr:alpha/beta hydrolase [Rhodococcus wratislaviensis]GAF47537.1 putative hydrolase [Rhodococcus wratislaviensis NBRC 100605]
MTRLWEEQVVTVDGVRYTGIDTGEGTEGARTVVLLHGNSGSWESFIPLIELLAPRQRVIAFDQRGFGGSVPLRDRLDYLEMADDTAAILRARGVESAIFVGFSMGAGVLQALAVRRPRLVDAALYGGMARIDGGPSSLDPSTLPPAVRASLIENRVPSDAEIRDSAGFAFGARTRREHPDLIEAVYERLRSHDWAAAAQRGLSASGLGDIDPRRMHAPAVVLIGEEDRCVPLASARELASALPDAELIVVPEAGHALMFEALPQVLAAVRRLEQRLIS